MAFRRWLRSHLTSVGIGFVASCALVALSGPAGASYRGGSHQSTATGGRIGSLTVSDAFLPDPASGSVASVYLTVKNSGAQADALIGVQSAGANGSMLMTENANGTMGMLSQLRIPAHGQASLVPGRDHVMLEQPRHALSLGQHVQVTLHFKRAGYLTISVPVVPLSRILSRN